MLLNRSCIFLVILLSVIKVGSCYFMGRSPPFFDQASSGYNGAMGYGYPSRYGQYPPYPPQYSPYQSQYSQYPGGIFGQQFSQFGETYPMGAGAMGAGVGGYPTMMGGGYPAMMGGGYPNAMMGGGLQNQLGKK